MDTSNPIAVANSSRRGFLQGSAASTLVLGFTLPLSGRALGATPSFAPNAWLRLAADGTVTVMCGSAEMGQGVLTAIPMLLAEELDADWSLVKVEQAPVDKAYVNPLFGMQATGGSTTVRAHWEPVRKAGAAAREMLVAAAAAQWKIDAALLRTQASQVIAPDGRKLSYGQLAPAAAALPVPENPKLKDAKDFRILGKAKPRLDTAPKTNGSAKFGIDAQVPGMLVAVMSRAPMPGAKPIKVDDSKAKAVKGVKQVLTIPSGVAVLATGYWAAQKARDLLDIEWDLGANTGLSSQKVDAILQGALAQEGALAKESGKVSPDASATVVRAQYEVPYLAHACMEPLNCTAWVKGDEVEIWAGTQAQGPAQGILGQVGQVSPAKVKVNTLLLGGGFGRRFAPDFTIDAVLLSKLSGAPVKLIYSRADDMAAGFYRPASIAKFEAHLDNRSMPVQMSVRAATPSIMAGSGFMKLPANGVDNMAVEGLNDHPYNIANQRISYHRAEPGPQVWFWRSVGHSQNAFFIESFIDELAAAAKRDPLEYRLALLAGKPRFQAVLKLAAAKAGWGKKLPAGSHHGIAVAECFGSYVAEVAEVSVAKDGSLRVHRVVAAVDCGQTVNPLIIERQIEGAIVFGLTAALYGKLSIKNGRIEQSNFHDYPVLRMDAMPKVEVHIVPSMEKPGGIGEPGTPPIAPAVANAIFAATGKRLRSLPFDTELLKKT